MRHDVVAGRGRQFVAQGRRSEQAVEAGRQGIRSTGRDEQPRPAIGDELGDAASIGSDHRDAGRLCLQDAQPERLRRGGVDEHVERTQHGGHLVDRAHEAGALAEQV